MTNTIILKFDTDAAKPIEFIKPETVTLPTTPEEMKAMVLNDVDCLSEALVDLIFKGNIGGFLNKEEEVAKAIRKLTNL